ncbi:MAG: caspase family protein [Phaeodactylibacter sp.]|nr:caspase family protein [Phaeodactylibacter sp.]MCB9304658.1 caspase family protein [Lewinellaceae bacterium]
MPKKKGAGFERQAEVKEPKRKSYFLGIGINLYQNFSPLNNAVKDVVDMARLLEEQYDIDEAIIITDREATHDNIIAHLDALKQKTGSNDKLLIFYSGHGHLDENQKGYWIPTDAEKDNTAHYIRNSTIRDYIEDFKALHTLLISDSCFSGSLFVRGVSRSSLAVEELEKRKSRWALCSGRHDEEVYDGKPGENSPFTTSILDTLRQSILPKINIAKLADMVIELTRSNYQQLPEGNPLYGVGHKGGQYIFRRKANEGEDWAACKSRDTLKAYQEFLEKYPEGKYAQEAAEWITWLTEEEAWKNACTRNTIGSYDDYLDKYLHGRYSDEAQSRISELQEEEDWQRALNADDLPAFRAYVRKYTKGKHSRDAFEKIKAIRKTLKEEDLWERAQKRNTLSAYQGYLEKYPAGRFREEAMQQIQQLGRAEPATKEPARETLEAPVLPEERQWAEVQKTDTYQAFMDYIQKYPEGKFAAQARKKASDLEQVAWNHLQTQMDIRRKGENEKIRLLEQYLKDYPGSQHNIAAKKQHDKLLVEWSQKARKRGRFWQFLLKKE